MAMISRLSRIRLVGSRPVMVRGSLPEMSGADHIAHIAKLVPASPEVSASVARFVPVVDSLRVPTSSMSGSR